jgi:hypothetical protein
LSTSGTEIFTAESPDIEIGARVRFKMGFDKLGIEQLAVGVELAEPVATITDAKIAPPKCRSK